MEKILGIKHKWEIEKMGLENFIPAAESAYAVKAAIDEALKAKETGEEKVIVAEISGNGFLDLEAWGRKLEIV